MEKEIWKQIKDYPNYEISNFGRVRNKEKGNILKQFKNNVGYVRVQLCYKNKPKSKSVHRLVAETYIPNPLKKSQVNHKDGNKENNVWTNLEWTTASENQKHAFKNGLGKPLWTNKFGGNHPTSKKVIQYSKDMKFIKLWNSVIEAEKELKISSSSISNCCSGRYKTAGGYIWKYEILERDKEVK